MKVEIEGPSRRQRVGPAIGAAVFIAGMLGPTGCMVGPNYQRPDAPISDSWDTPVPGDSVEAADPAWWKSFEDATLTALVEEACSQNLSLRRAGLRVLEARAARGIAVGEFFPQTQQAVGAAGANQLSRNDVAGDGDRSFATASVGIEAAWELDFWGKFRRGIESADAEVLLTVADYDAVLIALAAEVAATYIEIRSLEERLSYARANAELQAETLSLTQTRFRAGAVSELDVATARTTLANTLAFIPELENFRRKNVLALCVLLGRVPSSLESDLAPVNGAARLPETPAQIALGIPADLLRRRPDVRAAERAAAAQSARIGQAVADLYPQISIVGSTGFVSSNYDNAISPSLGNIFDANSFAGFIGLQVNWPFLQYGRIKGNIRVQDARYEQTVALYQETVLRAASDVEAGLSDFLKSRERAGYLKEAVAAGERSVELSLIQYRAGAADFIRVNNAQTELVVQQDAFVTSRAAIAQGVIRTYRALGGGWETRGSAEFVDPATAERMKARTNWGDIMEPAWDQGSDLGFDRSPHVTPTTPENHR